MSRYCLTIGLFLGLAAPSFSLTFADDAPPRDPSDVPLVAPAVRQAMQDRDFAAARKAIDEAAKDKDAPRDYLAYLRGWSLHLEKQYDPAIAAFAAFEKDYPKSAWLRRAEFAKAQAMVGKGDFRGAQAIYESEGKYLLSDERRQQSALVYLEFGDAKFEPSRAGQKSDYQAAWQFYTLAIDSGLKGPRQTDVEYRIAICHDRLGMHDAAVQAYERFLSRHADDPRQAEVRYRLGECHLRAGKHVEARKAWRGLGYVRLSSLTTKENQAGKPDVPKPRDWAAEAAFHLAETWRCPQPRDEYDLRHGVAALHDFLQRYPGHEFAGPAHLEIAASQINRQHYDDAIATLKDFLQDPRWKACKELPEAERTLGSVYATQKKYAEALAVWRGYLVHYPSHEGWTAVQQSIIDTEYAVGQEKFRSGDYDAAQRLLTEFAEHYPLDNRNPGILFLFGEIQQRGKKWEAAIAAWQRVIEKFPQSREAARAEAMIAHTLADELGRYEEARDHYKKAGDTAAAAVIAARQMRVETERAFRSDETPQLALATRNVPSVKVRAYKIDLETYFRKMHSVAGIERLDVSLIDPDATFDFAVPSYAKYKPLTSSIPLPLSDKATAGVAAVTVSSPTQEATTLVIQSDLQIVVSATRDELLVFAENVRTGKSWPGVRLLFSDGKSVFAEAKTGDDGFFSQPYRELQEAGYLRIFAAAEGGHVASTALSLAGEASDAKPVDRLAIETDRAAYRAGETVHVHGCARHIQGGHVTAEPGKKLTAELLDGADRRLRREIVTVSALGTFACDFPLPTGMPEAVYNVVVSDEAGHHRSARFDIGSPPVAAARLAIDLPRSVYYRGDTVEGTFRAMLPQDRPLINAKVQYSFGDLPSATVTTDARGEAHFAIATEDLDAAGAALLSATVAERDISARRTITVASRGFSIDLSTARQVYVAGESISVRIKTIDAASQPAAEKLLVKISRRHKVGDEMREEPVEEKNISTAADGLSEVTFKAVQGGPYSVRASGTDRFGNDIQRTLGIRVFGDDDPQQLLMLVDRTKLKAGDSAVTQLYWRGEPATAMVTTTYDRLREHRLITLQKGFNQFQFPATAAMAPGFTLSVAVMDPHGSRQPPAAVRLGTSGARSMPDTIAALHTSQCQFTVDPQLQVKIECHRHGDAAAKPLPGEPIDVTVTTCDAQGKPVAAEVNLSTLPADRSAAASEASDALAPLLLAGRGEADFETASSIQFRYRPVLRTTAPDEPEADAAAVSSHIMPQRGVTVPSHEQGDDPFGGDGAAQDQRPAAAKSPVVDDPFGTQSDGPEVQAAPNAHTKNFDTRVGASNVERYSPPPWPGYWNSSLATGADGRATVTITPPDDASDLVLTARAIAADNLTGRAAQPLALKKDLSAIIHLPPAITDGDEIEVPVVVQNDVLDQGNIEVELAVNVNGTTWSDKRTLVVKKRGRLETSFRPLVRQVQRPSNAAGSLPERPEAVFTVTTKAGKETNVVQRRVPIRPYGADFRVTAAGTAAGDAKFTIAPSRAHLSAPSLRISVSPNIARGLLDLLDRPAEDPTGPIAAEDGTEGIPAAGDLMAAAALAKLYPPNSSEGRLLDEKVRAALCLMIASQQRDGGWVIEGRPTKFASTAIAHWSLVLADKAGYSVPRDVLDAALANLRRTLTDSRDDNANVKAVVLHALALRGQGDFALANQLLRDRESLSPLGRDYLALALILMDRKDSAAEVLKAEKPPEAGTTNVATGAVTALALLELDPRSPRAKAIVDDILSHRAGLRWNPEIATGPAVLAAATWLAAEHAAEPAAHVTVAINGKPLKSLDLDPHGPTQALDVPMSMFAKGNQEIALHVAGTGRVSYRCELSGVVPAEHVAGTSAAWHIERTYEPPLRKVNDRQIPRGFSCLSGDAYAEAFKNRMSELPAAQCGFVELTAYGVRTEREEPDPFGLEASGGLMIVEPLPSGAAVVESSLQGAFDRADILPGRIVFYFRHLTPHSTIRYQLGGALAGANLIAPTILRRIGSDAPLAVSKPKSLVVLPQGAKSNDPYRLSPDELLALGTLAQRKGDAEAAMRYFSELLEKWHGQKTFGLDEAAHKQTVFALMELGMGRGGKLACAPAKLVEYCETIKEKWPTAPVTLEQLLTAAAAYREIGELERSYVACRAAVEGSFTRESGVAGFLDNQGAEGGSNFLRSVTWMNRLFRDYPPEAYACEAEFDLAQRVYAKASEPQAAASRQPQLARDNLIARAGEKLDAFLTAFPNDPAADQAAFAAASAQLDLKHYAAAAETSMAAARRYPKSDLVDSYWYMLGYCDFALGKYPAAIELCRKVSEAQHLDKESGRMVESQNKYRAIYILGQIYQSLGQRGDAIREYRRVEDRIPDAKASVNYLVRKEIVLPECTTLRPGTAADMELRYRNLATCDMKVYRVDLVKFCEAGQALGDIGQVNLAGIRPLSQESLALAGSGDYADHVQKLSLPVKKEGAYLVVCRGEDLYASGLLVISPLEMEQRLDAATGQVHVFVKDVATGRCASEVQVKLLPRGPNPQANLAGTTDLRGIFAAGCPAGGATIVAQAGPGQYAYLACPAIANETKASVAQSRAGDVDPTAPFANADLQPLRDLIAETKQQSIWTDNEAQPNSEVRGQRRSSRDENPFGTNLSLEISQSQTGPHAPTQLSGEESPAERKIRAALESPATIEFVETPLKDVVDYLKDVYKIEIQIDTAGMKDAGVDENTPVTKNIKGLTLRSALRLILDELQLKYVIHNEVLLITSPQKAESDEFMVTKAYPVQDLVLPQGGDTVDFQFQPLKDLLTNTVAQKSWLDNGGTGSISDMVVGNRALLVLSQTQEVHEQIEETLAMLRKAGGLKAGARKLAEQEELMEEPQAAARQLRVRSAAPQAQGMGMGGMGGGMNGRGPTPYVISVTPVIDGGNDADLLGGLKSANAANQKSKAQHLKQRQDAGQNGAGGMGGGFF